MEAVAVKKAPKTNAHSSQKKNAGSSTFFPAQNKKPQSSKNTSLFADSDVFFPPAAGYSKAKNLDQNKDTESGNQAENFERNPELNPAYLQVVESINSKAEAQKAHEEADKESQTAQSAAPFDPQEREGIAQTSHIESMDEQEAQEFDVERFKSQLRERINQLQLPENLEEADEFDKNNNIDEVSTDIAQDAGQEQEMVGSAIEAASSSNPNVDAVSPRVPSELPDKAPVGDKPTSVAVAGAVPPARSESVISEPLAQNMGEIHKLTDENNITDEQLAKSNESHFVAALSSKEKAKKHTDESVGNFKIQEESVLSNTEQRNQAGSQTFLSSIHDERTNQLSDVLSGQQNTKDENAAKRVEIAAHIHSIFEETRDRVQAHLDNLDQEVSKRFGKITRTAKGNFEAYIERRMTAYKEERYSGAGGKLLWAKDKLLGLPEEVNIYFTQGKERFIKELDNSLIGIANYVGQQLTEAKRIIADGKQKISDYVQSLHESLKEMGAEAAQDIQTKFDQLEQNVDNKQEELIDSLARQYVQASEEVDERIEEMQAENRGLVDAALESLNSIIVFIVEIKTILSELLSSAIAVIGAIIEDPIQFLLNLFSGIIQGLENFLSNIVQHLKAGLIGWLIGALGSMGITLPENLFSLKGIFSLVAQILGITWDYIRQKAVRALGEKVVSAMESGFEIFMVIKTEGVAGLWKYIQEKFNDLKTLVIDAIQDLLITKVIMAGVKWIMSLLSPASAFVKAVLMIVDIIKFFVQKAAQIFELVKAFIESVKAIASGSVEFVAKAIENALSKALPVLIGFLASLLGVTGLTQRVQAIVFKIRARLDSAIDSIIDKAKAWFKKIGGKIKAGAVAIKEKILEWWKIKRKFKANDGQEHSLYFEGSEDSSVLMIASNPGPFYSFLEKVEVGEDNEKAEAKKKALILAKKIDSEKNSRLDKSIEKETARLQKAAAIEALIIELSEVAKVLFGTTDGVLPDSNISPQSVGSSEMGESMFANILTKKNKDKGSSPSGTISLFDKLLLRRDGGRSYYIRGHLLNQQLGGLGVWENMTILSQTGNRNHEKEVESTVKAAVFSGAIVKYTVETKKRDENESSLRDFEPDEAKLAERQEDVNIINDIRSAERKIPLFLNISASLLEKNTQGSYEEKQKIPVKPKVDNTIETGIQDYDLGNTPRKRLLRINLSEPGDDFIDSLSRLYGIGEVRAAIIKNKGPFQSRADFESKMIGTGVTKEMISQWIVNNSPKVVFTKDDPSTEWKES